MLPKQKWLKVASFIVLLIFVLACDFSFNSREEAGQSIETQLTMQALAQTQTAVAAPAQPPAQPPAADQSSNGDQSAQDDQETQEADEDEDGIPCNASKFVSETIPDGTEYDPDETFTKTWTIRNNGSCDWTKGYTFVFEEGNRMDGDSSMNLSKVVKPGDTYTFSLNLKAPDTNGDYTGVWRIKADDGEKLGKYWVKINVGPAAFAVTSVSTTLANLNPAACPATKDVDINITTNAAGNVSYQTERSDTGLGSAKSTLFNSATTKIVEFDWDGLTTGDYWLKVHIHEPNNQTFGPYNFSVTCP